MSSEADKRALLGQLRIDRSAPQAGVASGRRTWMIGAIVVLVALIGGAGWLALSGGAALPVHTQYAGRADI